MPAKPNHCSRLIGTCGISTLALLVGGMIGFVISKRSCLEFEATITGGNVLQSLSTIAAAVAVAAYFQRLVQTDRSEKALLLVQFDLMLGFIAEFEALDHSTDLVDVTTLLKKMSQKAMFTKTFIADCGYSATVCASSDFGELIADLKRLATDTPTREVEAYAQREDCPIYVKDGIVNWARDRKRELEQKLESLKSAVFAAQIILNKA